MKFSGVITTLAPLPVFSVFQGVIRCYLFLEARFLDVTFFLNVFQRSNYELISTRFNFIIDISMRHVDVCLLFFGSRGLFSLIQNFANFLFARVNRKEQFNQQVLFYNDEITLIILIYYSYTCKKFARSKERLLAESATEGNYLVLENVKIIEL
jgi:hypothetical protein